MSIDNPPSTPNAPSTPEPSTPEPSSPEVPSQPSSPEPMPQTPDEPLPFVDGGSGMDNSGVDDELTPSNIDPDIDPDPR
jgi:hypothetical protein